MGIAARILNLQDEELDAAAKAATAEKDPPKTTTIEEEYKPTLARPTSTPYPSSPKIENTAAVNSHVDPLFQQKSPCHHRSSDLADVVEDVDCFADVVIRDGTATSTQTPDYHISNTDSEKAISAEDDYREYFKEHGPSPISEIEMAETRKPISQATDESMNGDANDDGINYDVIGWKEEQMDSAEEALKRGEAIFRERAEEGVPDWPQSRVLQH